MPVSEYKTFEIVTKPWPGCGFTKKTATLKVRRVTPGGVSTGDNEAQIEINITEVKGNRIYSRCASMSLTPDQAREFADALGVV